MTQEKTRILKRHNKDKSITFIPEIFREGEWKLLHKGNWILPPATTLEEAQSRIDHYFYTPPKNEIIEYPLKGESDE